MMAFYVNAQSNIFPEFSKKFQYPQTLNNTFQNYNFQPHILKLPDSTIVHFQQPQDNFVLKLPVPKLSYKENANSFDIYQATPDQMFVIKPDSTIHFNMPVAFNTKKKAIEISNESFSQP
jgi:hypothetical protein